MSMVDALGQSVVAARERKRLLDLLGLLMTIVVIGVVVVAWSLRLIDRPITPILRVGLGYLLSHALISGLTDRLGTSRAIDRAGRLLQLTLIPFLAAVWHLAGGVDVPGLLLTFILPLAASGGTVFRWQPLILAATSIGVVGAVAVAESPALGWYLVQIGMPPWLIEIGTHLPIESFVATQEPRSTALHLLVFTCAMSCGAATIRYVSYQMHRMSARLDASAAHMAEVTGLFQAVQKAAPEPSVIVYADTAQVVYASDSFLRSMMIEPTALVGKTLFEVVTFTRDDRLRRRLLGEGGREAYCGYRVGPEARVANLTIYPVRHDDTGYVYIGFHDVTEQYYLHAAFDAIDEPLIVVGHDDRLRYSNRAAEDLFGALQFGMDVTEALAAPGLGKSWWRFAPTGRHRLVIADYPYLVAVTAAPLPGEPTGSFIISMRSVAREEELSRQATLDPLTGLYGSSAFELLLPSQQGLAEHAVRQALVRCELSGFGELRQLGAAVADAGVVALAAAIRAELRPSDIAARLSEAEFAILLRDMAGDEASLIVDRIARRLGRIAIDGVTPGELSLAAGVVSVRADETTGQLLGRVGLALDGARRAGRGRCLVLD